VMDWHSGRRRLLRWMLTQWCNYKCRYCRQDHRRDQEFNGARGHFTDNAPVERWLGALDKHFSPYAVTVTLTGGETMIDKRAMQPLLAGLASRAWVDAVRIDTNGSWCDQDYSALPKAKFTLMVSYHPSEVTEAEFFRQLRALLSAGWPVSMVTLVVLPDRVKYLKRLAEKLRPIPLSAMPVFGDIGFFTDEQRALLKSMVPSEDWSNRSGDSTRGRACLYPAVAYEMYPDGKLETACHPHLAGSLFADTLPALFPSYTPCPHAKCTCVDRYTFLGDLKVDNSITPTHGYARRLSLL